jgi:hypothetical protein
MWMTLQYSYQDVFLQWYIVFDMIRPLHSYCSLMRLHKHEQIIFSVIFHFCCCPFCYFYLWEQDRVCQIKEWRTTLFLVFFGIAVMDEDKENYTSIVFIILEALIYNSFVLLSN